MPASYFHKAGEGHSRRGRATRSHGAVTWGRLPAALRRDPTAADAHTLQISLEWHHAGKHATETFVYYPQQVEAYWKAFDAAGGVLSDALDTQARTQLLLGQLSPIREQAVRAAWADTSAATRAAEQAREHLTEEAPAEAVTSPTASRGEVCL